MRHVRTTGTCEHRPHTGNPSIRYCRNTQRRFGKSEVLQITVLFDSSNPTLSLLRGLILRPSKICAYWPEEISAPGFFAKAEMGSIRFQRRKIFLAVIAFGGPRSSCSGRGPRPTTPLRYAVRHWPAQMTLRRVGMALHFDYASARSGQRRPQPPSAHRTVRTGPYTAPHARLIH